MGNKLYVGNLPYSTSIDELKDLFSPCGEVKDAIIITDRETGRSKGFGFITMADDDGARTAMDDLNGREIGGRKLTVNEAREKERSSGGGGGGRRDRR
jgi:RNA recognition motif-containing protein